MAMDTLEDSDPEFQHDAGNPTQDVCVQHDPALDHQLRLDTAIPVQFPSTCCYGRGKQLKDIVVPRLPAVLQDDFCDTGDSCLFDKNWQNVVPTHIAKSKKGGTERRTTSLGRGKALEHQSICVKAEQEDQKPATSSPNKRTTQVNYPPTNSKSWLIEPSIEPEFYRKPVKLNTFSVKSCEDFPSLSAASKIPSPASKDGRKKSKSSRGSVSSSVGSSFGVFEDADTLSTCGETELINADLQNSTSFEPGHSFPATADVCDASSSGLNDIDDPSSLIDKTNAHNTCLTSEDNSLSNLDAELRVYIENHNVKENVKNSNTKEEEDVAEDGTETLEAKLPMKAKGKKKAVGGWKLDGPCVVQVESIPNGFGEQLTHCMSNFGKVVDFEKKTKKGGSAWRFRFETKDICDYVVECLHGSELFDGVSAPLNCYCLEDGRLNGAAS